MMMSYLDPLAETSMMNSEMMFRNTGRTVPGSELGLCGGERKSKRVSFRESENVVVYFSGTRDSSIWYSDEEIGEMKKWVEMASIGVTEACGEIDLDDRVAECRRAIVQAQRMPQEDLYRISELHSEESVKVARLHAIILAQDVAMEGNPVTKEALCEMVYRAILEGEDEDSSVGDITHFVLDETIGDDNDSIGTIDEWPQETSEPIDATCDIDDSRSFTREDRRSSISVQSDLTLFTKGRETPQQSNTGANQMASTVDNEMIDEKLIEHSESPVCNCPPPATDSSQLSPGRKSVHHVGHSSIVKSPLSGILSSSSDFPTPESSSKIQEGQSDHQDLKPCGLSVGDAKSMITGKRNRETCKERFSALPPCSKRPCRGPSAPKNKQNIDFGPQVAHALITLARWEFRSSRLPRQS